METAKSTDSNAENVKLQTKEMQTSFCSHVKFTIEAPLFNTILYQCKHGTSRLRSTIYFDDDFRISCFAIISIISARKNETKEITYTTTNHLLTLTLYLARPV